VAGVAGEAGVAAVPVEGSAGVAGVAGVAGSAGWAALSDAGVSAGCAISTALVLSASEAAAKVVNIVDLRILMSPFGGTDEAWPAR
jgi:hypothetical protein